MRSGTTPGFNPGTTGKRSRGLNAGTWLGRYQLGGSEHVDSPESRVKPWIQGGSCAQHLGQGSGWELLQGPKTPGTSPTKGTRHVLKGATCVSASRTDARGRNKERATTTASAQLAGRRLVPRERLSCCRVQLISLSMCLGIRHEPIRRTKQQQGAAGTTWRATVGHGQWQPE